MKVTDLKEYTDEELREIYNSMYPTDDGPITLPKYPKVEAYINKENPQIGNYMTRYIRVSNLIKSEGFSRFLNEKVNRLS